MQLPISRLFCGLMILTLLGCGGPTDNVGPTIAVEGKVTLGSKPVTNGTVIFRPDNSKGNFLPHEPRGQLDEQGTYRLSTAGKVGAPPGWYKVAIAAAKPVPTGGHGHNPHAPPIWIIATKYLDPNRSGLVCEVVNSPSPGAYDFRVTGPE